VVVEATAGEFFEARVLGSEGDRLRVQRADVESTLSVPRADVYPLPGHGAEPQAFAVCERQASHWVGCRIERLAGAELVAGSADGEELTLAPERVLAVTSFTATNIEHRFERLAQHEDYARLAARAGEPQRDPSFRPLPRARVVAKIGNDWFTAYIAEVDDDGLIVSLAERSRREKVPARAVIAEPPYPLDLHRGQFVLVRPSTQSEPWPRRMVRSSGAGELRLVDAAGTTVLASPRDVIPLIAN
jgi:hypothetical protein